MYRVLRSILKNGARQENIPTQVASAEKGKVRVDYYVACVHPHTCMPLFVVPDHIHSEILKTLLKLGRSSPLITKKKCNMPDYYSFTHFGFGRRSLLCSLGYSTLIHTSIPVFS